MINQTVTPDKAVAYLNELIEIDGAAIGALIENRVPCNQSLAEHPSVQVSGEYDNFKVGLLGILNGLFGADKSGWGTITVTLKDGYPIKATRTEHHK